MYFDKKMSENISVIKTLQMIKLDKQPPYIKFISHKNLLTFSLSLFKNKNI